MASVSEDGGLNLWDSNKMQLLKAFKNEHKAPATGLSFSPVNDMLLNSVGLDKRIVFYDVNSKRYVTEDFPAGEPAFFHRGASLKQFAPHKILSKDNRKNSITM